jgi:HEPN domain-containing protein
MKAFFSKRHEEALLEKGISPSFPSRCRVSIERVLNNNSEYGNWLDETTDRYFSNANITYLDAEETLKTFYGVNKLLAFDKDNKRAPANFSELILNGYPSEVLDAIEAWFYQNPPKTKDCETELNDIFSINSSRWRIVNGDAILVDSDYLYSEIKRKSITLLSECEIPGALEEFQDAINDLTSGETKDAVVKAHKSVESVMKAVLEIDEPLTYYALLSKLIKSKVIPKYYEEFFIHFEKLALGVAKERNLPARGHGQGKKTATVSPSLAEFTVNLAGAMNIFILKHYIDVHPLLESQQKLELDVEDS